MEYIGYLLDQHQFVVLFVKGGVQHRVRVGVEPREQLLVGARYPGRGVFQAVPVRIFAHRDQQLADGRLRTRLIELCGFEFDRVVLRPRH